MKIVFIGDIFGRPGRQAVKQNLPKIIDEYSPDFVIANVENLAGGKGATLKTLQEMKEAGVDIFTGGNHIFHEQEIFNGKYKIARPANYPGNPPGNDYVIVKKAGKNILVINLMGRTFISELLECPFRTLERIISETKKQDIDAVIVDFHAEATSEKAALKWYFDGKVSAIFGTHTHVATCDSEITKKGTFFVSDVGMAGPIDSVIGLKPDSVFPRFLEAMPIKFNVAKGRTIFQGFMLDIEDKKVQNFHRFEIFDQ